MAQPTAPRAAGPSPLRIPGLRAPPQAWHRQRGWRARRGTCARERAPQMGARRRPAPHPPRLLVRAGMRSDVWGGVAENACSAGLAALTQKERPYHVNSRLPFPRMQSSRATVTVSGHPGTLATNPQRDGPGRRRSRGGCDLQKARRVGAPAASCTVQEPAPTGCYQPPHLRPRPFRTAGRAQQAQGPDSLPRLGVTALFAILEAPSPAATGWQHAQNFFATGAATHKGEGGWKAGHLAWGCESRLKQARRCLARARGPLLSLLRSRGRAALSSLASACERSFAPPEGDTFAYRRNCVQTTRAGWTIQNTYQRGLAALHRQLLGWGSQRLLPPKQRRERAAPKRKRGRTSAQALPPRGGGVQRGGWSGAAQGPNTVLPKDLATQEVSGTLAAVVVQPNTTLLCAALERRRPRDSGKRQVDHQPRRVCVQLTAAAP
jgi:hypothetical protein